MTEDREEFEIGRELWYKQQDDDEEWIKEQEAITEANSLGVDLDLLEHIDSAMKIILGEQDDRRPNK